MAAPGHGAIEIEIIGLKGALELEGLLEHAIASLPRDVADGMAHEVRSNIRSKSGKLAQSWHGVVHRGGNAAVVSAGVAYARASVTGAYMTPKKKAGRRGLKLADGRFRIWSRIAAGAWTGNPRSTRSYVNIAFESFPAVTAAAFSLHFSNLKRPVP